MTITLELTPDMVQKIADMAAGREKNEEAMRRTFAELTAQINLPNISKGNAPREAGFLRGAFIISDDFDAPLPDSFWLGEE